MLLELTNVVAGYLPEVNVLQGINIQVEKGELVCMVGPNGAGKSTVLRTISGLLKPTQGEILFEGKKISGLRPDLVLQKGIAHIPQGHSSFPEMTVHENLLMGAYILRDGAERERRLRRVYGMFPFLKERKNEKAGNFSGGQQKILEVGRALMLEPKMILLDEPSLGLAPITAKHVFETIRSLRDQMGMTVLMVEQNAKSGLTIADRAYVLELGRECLEGPANTLLTDPRVAELYLGGTLKS